MKYHELQVNAFKSKKRVGRGIASGQGKTAGRGTKGQKARTGSRQKPGFAGGQNPLMQQLPKLPGFRSHRQKTENVFTDQITPLKTSPITAVTLNDAKLISNPYVYVKLLSRGKVSKKVNVELSNASQTAIKAIEEAGGTFKKVPRLSRPKNKEQKDNK